MKHAVILFALLFCFSVCFSGCENTGEVKSNSASGQRLTESSNADTTQNSDGSQGSATPVVFKLTETATTQVRAAMASVRGTHLVVSVDVDDEKYCVGFHYSLNVENAPSKSRFEMLESNGIKLAIEKDDIEFLNGTTLDFAKLESGTEGFVFRNPNENVSIPEELRDQSQTDSTEQDSPQ